MRRAVRQPWKVKGGKSPKRSTPRRSNQYSNDASRCVPRFRDAQKFSPLHPPFVIEQKKKKNTSCHTAWNAQDVLQARIANRFSRTKQQCAPLHSPRSARGKSRDCVFWRPREGRKPDCVRKTSATPSRRRWRGCPRQRRAYLQRSELGAGAVYHEIERAAWVTHIELHCQRKRNCILFFGDDFCHPSRSRCFVF